MKISIIGTGYVGLVTGVCLADIGHDVICLDISESKIRALQSGEPTIYEPSLEKKLKHCLSIKNLQFMHFYSEKISESDVVILAVGTPEGENGEANLSYLFNAVEEVRKYLTGHQVVVVKSTVPPGTNLYIKNMLSDRVKDVVSNPEFLREGFAINDFYNPDRIVFGRTPDPETDQTLLEIYRPITSESTPIVMTDQTSSELIKYAANAFLATKISFINEMAALCAKIDGDIKAVSRGMGLDQRIGSEFLKPGPGYGGSCFPKDTKALQKICEEQDTNSCIVDATIKANAQAKIRAVKLITETLSSIKENFKVCLLGCTFKPGTDDMREAPSIEIYEALCELNAKIVVCDEQGYEQGHKLFKDVDWIIDPYAAVRECDAVILVTEWRRFLSLDLKLIASNMRGNNFIDLKFAYETSQMNEAGLKYVSL